MKITELYLNVLKGKGGEFSIQEKEFKNKVEDKQCIIVKKKERMNENPSPIHFATNHTIFKKLVPIDL